MIDWRQILKSRRALIVTATLAVAYLLAGFLLLPFLIRHYGPSIASAQLQRPVTVGTVRFNPLLFRLELEDFALTEPQGQPLVRLQHLYADLELKGLFYRALAFREIRLEKLSVRPTIEPDGRLNFAKIADALPPSDEPEPPPEKAGLPRLLIDHFALLDGAVEFSDQSKNPEVSERVDAINLKLDAISTLPDNQASHHISAAFADGSVLDWHGQVSFNPLASEGELRLDGFKVATPWLFMKDRIALEQPEGQLAVAAAYRARQEGDNLQLALSEIGATVDGLKLVPASGKEPIVTLEKAQLSHGSLDLGERSLKIPEFVIQKGKLKGGIDNQGALDWQQLVKPVAAPAASPPSGTPPVNPASAAPKPWHVAVETLKVDELALQFADASRQLPIDVNVGAFGLGLKLDLEAGAGDPKVSITGLSSEIRDLALKAVDGTEPLLAIETFQIGDGTLDLSSRTLKLPLVSIRKGAVRTEVDELGLVNWQKVAQTASSPVRSDAAASQATAPPPSSQPQDQLPPVAPWHVEVDRLQIEQVGLHYADDSRRSPIQLDVANFGLGLRAALEAGAGAPRVIIDGLQSDIKQIVLRERAREKPLASLDSLGLNGGKIDLAQNEIGIQQITLGGGTTAIERDEKGAIHLAEVLPSRDEGKVGQAVRHAGAAAKAEGKAWQLAVDQVNLNGFQAVIDDHSTAPPFHAELRPADFHLKHVANFGKTPVAFDGRIKIVQGGDLSFHGTATSTGERGQAEIRLDRFALAGLQPYVAQVGALKLESGNLSTRVNVGFQQKAGKMSITAKGEVNSADLLLKETKTGKRFAAWERLAVAGIDFSLSPNKLAIKEIHAIKPGANIEIFEDRTTNINAIFKQKPGAPAPQTSKVVAAKPIAAKPFPFSVQRVKVDEAVVDFSDLSLVLPFKTRIQNFGGTISGISNAPAARTLLKLDGRVDEYGEANLEGTLDLMQHSAFSDVTLIFRNVEMSSLSPYSGTFAGRRIQSGKLNAELQYKIDNSRLNSHGKIELDQFALGSEVVSPKAKSLPLDLAVALLTDNSGKITVSVPIEGDVNDPQFAYGSVIWDAIVTLITKAVTAPFSALAGVFGSGEEDIGEVLFIPGKNGLPPAEIEKLKKLAGGLSTRPNVVLKVEGTFDPKLDAEALKSWDIRTSVTEKLGIKVLPGEDPGPVAFDNAKAQRALEDLVDERRSDGSLTSAQAAFRDKFGREPKRVGALSAWMDKPSEDAPFYQLLFDQLVQSTPLPPTSLEALAERRSEAIVKELAVHKGVDRSRLRIEKVISADDKDGRIPTKLNLAVAAQ